MLCKGGMWECKSVQQLLWTTRRNVPKPLIKCLKEQQVRQCMSLRADFLHSQRVSKCWQELLVKTLLLSWKLLFTYQYCGYIQIMWYWYQHEKVIKESHLPLMTCIIYCRCFPASLSSYFTLWGSIFNTKVAHTF